MLRLLGVATIYYTECMGTEFDFIGWFLCSYVAQNATQRSLLPRHGRTLSCKHIQISNGSSSFDMYKKTVGFQGGNLGFWSNMKGAPGRAACYFNKPFAFLKSTVFLYISILDNPIHACLPIFTKHHVEIFIWKYLFKRWDSTCQTCLVASGTFKLTVVRCMPTGPRCLATKVCSLVTSARAC